MRGVQIMNEIIQYLKRHGERLDTEIAEAVGISLAETRHHLLALVDKKEVMSCHSIKLVDGKMAERMSYRLVGFFPKAKSGAKRCTQLRL